MNAPDRAEAKQAAAATIDRIAEDLTNLSHAIHARPELCYEEHFAAGELSQALRRHGVQVDAPAFDLPTSFVGRCGSTGPHIDICCEYDALPGIGHGCGHNIIGTAGVGAGIALAPLAHALGGRVTILGTPAEEGGGGKLLLLERGAFADADVAMMIQPEPANVEIVPYLANETLVITMHGKAAHASSSARAGVNALDAPRNEQPAAPAADVECRLTRCDVRAEEGDLGSVEVEVGPPAGDQTVVPGRRRRRIADVIVAHRQHARATRLASFGQFGAYRWPSTALRYSLSPSAR